MNKKTLVIVLMLIVFLAGYYIVGSKPADTVMVREEEVDMTMQPKVDDTPNIAATPARTVTETAVRTFAVDGGNYYFAPSEMRVKKGDTVKIVFTNSGGMHDLRIDDFGVATKKLTNGQSDTITFVADKTGSFKFYCSIGSHEAMGMRGMLIVE